MIRTAYFAAEGFEAPLAEELRRAGIMVSRWHGRLALSPDPPVHAAWAQDVWTAPVEIAAPSIGAAASALRAIQRNWSGYAVDHHRRSALIAAALPPIKQRLMAFPEPAPTAPLGAWTLLDAGRMLVSATKTSPWANGACGFAQDHIGPPSRAYLKLWEALTRIGAWPGPGQACIDLGAAPGGWTWAIARLGARVIAVDKAPLAPSVAAMPGVQERRESAFAMAPEPADWLFSDVVAYPARLLDLVERWIASGAVPRIVCTIKFQGETDHDAADAFARIAGGRLTHLFHNRHELTFIWQSACG